MIHKFAAILIILVLALILSPGNAEVLPSTVMAVDANVLDHGAVADGVTDCTAAFQKALDTVKKNGGIVYAPAGRYMFRGHLLIPSGATLMGSWQGPPAREAGTILLATEDAGNPDGDAFVTLEGNAGIKGLIINYPEQPSDAETPILYPWTIRGLAQDCQISDLMFIRAYRGVDFGTYPCSRFYINNLYGSVLSRGIYIDGSVDVNRMNNVHFSAWGCAAKTNKWRRDNLEVITVGKADWLWMTNVFCFEAAVGVRFIYGKGSNGKPEGPSNYVQISHSGFDDTTSPIIVEQCEVLNISQSVFKGKAIEIRETSANSIRFSQCNFSPIPGTGTLVDAKGVGKVSFTDCTFEFWDTEGLWLPALKASCVSLSVQGCEFGVHNRPSFVRGSTLAKTQIEITPEVKSAVIQGNRLRYGKRIINKSKGNIIIKDNVIDDYDLPMFQPKPAKSTLDE
ncbi:MAG: glycosyl hydrolase family 28-related protein [Armatimonadota bacterium]